MEEPIVIGKDKFKIGEEETVRREARFFKVHGILAPVGTNSENRIKVAKEEFGWGDICE